MTENVIIDPKTQMTETKGNEFLSAKNNYGDVELRNLSIFGIGNAESENLNKVTVYTSEYNDNSQQIQVPGQNEIAFIEKLVFIDEKTIVCEVSSSRACACNKNSSGICRELEICLSAAIKLADSARSA